MSEMISNYIKESIFEMLRENKSSKVEDFVDNIVYNLDVDKQPEPIDVDMDTGEVTFDEDEFNKNITNKGKTIFVSFNVVPPKQKEFSVEFTIERNKVSNLSVVSGTGNGSGDALLSKTYSFSDRDAKKIANDIDKYI